MKMRQALAAYSHSQPVSYAHSQRNPWLQLPSWEGKSKEQQTCNCSKGICNAVFTELGCVGPDPQLGLLQCNFYQQTLQYHTQEMGRFGFDHSLQGEALRWRQKQLVKKKQQLVHCGDLRVLVPCKEEVWVYS